MFALTERGTRAAARARVTGSYGYCVFAAGDYSRLMRARLDSGGIAFGLNLEEGGELVHGAAGRFNPVSDQSLAHRTVPKTVRHGGAELSTTAVGVPARLTSPSQELPLDPLSLGRTTISRWSWSERRRAVLATRMRTGLNPYPLQPTGLSRWSLSELGIGPQT